ncbi:hypothetical protein PM033_15240 [Halorubrum ezzemoulense]|uniref:hypothetical protein n=1 Tax=Halorubrum ezzemoulense TaxID=337243 RepID=UPI00232C0F15|nr:hypothetical protein [Halorubrum ezzemoulense]MDB2253099.1 hypothetical protein [Halorubrum ezzemoulense]
MELRRRTFIGGFSLALLGFSGCLGVNSGGTTDITIANETSNTVTTSIHVTQLSNDTQLLDDTVTIDVGETEEYEEVVSGAQVEVSLSVENGPEDTYEWSDGESDAQGLHIDINDDSIAFSSFVD